MSEITLHIGELDSYHTINIECLQHNGTTKTFDMEIHVLPQSRPRIFEIKIDGESVYSSKEIIAQGGFLIPNTVEYIPRPGFINFVRRTFRIGGWKKVSGMHDQILNLAKQMKVSRGHQ